MQQMVKGVRRGGEGGVGREGWGGRGGEGGVGREGWGGRGGEGQEIYYYRAKWLYISPLHCH